MAIFTLPQFGEMFGETFRTEFCFLPRFFACFARGSGQFVLFSLLEKYGLGKLLSVNYLFGFFELKFVRIMRIYRRRDCAAQTMPCPNTHDFACNAGLFAAADKRVPQLVRVMVRQQPLHARGYRVEVGVLRFLEVDIGQHLSRHRRKRYFPKHDILPQPFLARFTL